MFGWRPLNEARFASVWFRTDGSILTPEGCHPQSIALAERNVEGVKISKAGGEGSPVTLQGNDANRMTLKFEAGKWWAEGFVPLVQETPFVPEQHPVAAQTSPADQRTQQDLRPYLWPLITIFCVVGAIVLAALYVLREPIKEASRTKRLAEQNAQIELLNKANREALEQTVNDLHGQATTKLEALEADSKQYRDRFRQAIGIPVDHAIGSAQQRPREVNLAILKDRSIADAWTALLNAHVPQNDIASRRQTLSSMRTRLDKGAVQKDDEQNLKDLIGWIDERKGAIDAQAENLERLRRRLVEERAELEAERRTP